MLLPTCTCGVGMRVAVTTMVSGMSSTSATATHVNIGMDATMTTNNDLRTKLSWIGAQEPARDSAFMLIFSNQRLRGDDSTLSSRRFPPQLLAHPGQ